MISEDFGQRVDLGQRIRDILESYPEGPAILFELLQNAEDAGAHSVAIVLDHRAHAGRRLVFPAAEKVHSSPSLCVINDAAPFSERDFEGISSIGRSQKRQSKGKIGKFGVGFNSVYHLTDMPQFITGEWLVMFDPSCTLLRTATSGALSVPAQQEKSGGVITGKRINLLSMESSLLSASGQYRDQIQPFVIPPGVDGLPEVSPGAKSFEGSFFRFPLRMKVRSNSLSKSQHTPASMVSLLESFILDLENGALLFLNKIQKVDIWEWKDRTGPRLLHRTCRRCEHVNPRLCKTVISSSSFQDKAQKATEQSYIVALSKPPEGSFNINSIVSADLQNVLSEVGIDELIFSEPFAAVGVPLETHIEGKAFAALPLPISTKLPVQINSSFEVKSDRQSLWYMNSETRLQGLAKLKSTWNRKMIEELVPSAYLSALEYIAQKNIMELDKRLALLPGSDRSLETLEPPWKLLAVSVYRQMQSSNFQAMMFQAKDFWYYSSRDTMAEEASSLLTDLTGRRLVKTPWQLLQNFLSEKIISASSILSPGGVRALCRAAPEMNKRLENLPLECAEQWIQYALSDLQDASILSETLNKELAGIPLIPVASGRLMTKGRQFYSLSGPVGDASPFGGFSKLLVSGDTDSIISAARNVVINPQMSPILCQRLKNFHQVLEIRTVQEHPSFFLEMLGAVFPAEWQQNQSIEWPSGAREWKLVWDCCEVAFLNDLTKALPFLTKWPILAVTNSAKDQSIQGRASPESSTNAGSALRLYKLSSVNSIVKTDPSLLNKGTRSVLDGLNVGFVDDVQRQLLDSIRALVAKGQNASTSANFIHDCFDPSIFLVCQTQAQRIHAGGLGGLIAKYSNEDLKDFKEHLMEVAKSGRTQEGSSHALEKMTELPIFKIVGHSQRRPLDIAAPAQRRPYIVGPDMLQIADIIPDAPLAVVPETSAEQYFLSQRLRLREPSEGEIYLEFVAPYVRDLRLGDGAQGSEEQGQRISLAMLNLLRKLPILDSREPSKSAALRQTLESLPFVRTLAGTIEAPCRLYDPELCEFAELLCEDSFPDDSFQSAINLLRELGLRTQIRASDVIKSANAIQESHSVEKAHHLLRFLDRDPMGWMEPAPGSQLQTKSKGRHFFKSMKKLFRQGTQSKNADESSHSETESVGEEFWETLRKMSWCPVLQDNPHPNVLPWYHDTQPNRALIAKPEDVRPQAQAWMCSGILPLADSVDISVPLKEKLGWSKKLAPEVLVNQLLAIGQLHGEAVRDAKILQQLTVQIPLIYNDLLNREIALPIDRLRDSPIIWIGDGFVEPRRVAMRGSTALKPLLITLPQDLLCFSAVLTKMGVVEEFSSLAYIEFLGKLPQDLRQSPYTMKEIVWVSLEIAGKIEALQKINDTAQGKQFLAEEGFLDVAAIYDPDKKMDAISQICARIRLPDTKGKLRDSKDLLVDDMPWWSEQSLDTNFLHPDISHKVARTLRIASRRDALMSDESQTLALQFESNSGFLAFGQSEVLTTRLRHVIDQYVEGPTVLFELLQNADDAGASEVKFVLDMRHYGCETTISRNMSHWQGPALLCYNNAHFKETDFVNIARIGQPSKSGDPCASGRFGLGFNSVYNYTDLPSFISGKYLVLFDPHVRFLPGVSIAAPGLKIDISRQGILDKFPDQFHPYQCLGHNLYRKEGFDGTLFRIPLRRAIGDPELLSEISRKDYNPQDIMELFRDITKATSCPPLQHSLLFLKNVRSLSFSVLNNDDSARQRILYQANLKVYKNDSLTSSPVLQLSKQMRRIHNRSERLAQMIQPTVRINVETTESWNPHQDEAHTSTSDFTLAVGLFNSSGLRSSVDSLSKIGRTVLPWASIAVPHTGDCCGNLFSNLPLPASTELPFYANAPFEISSNRRELWLGSDMKEGASLIRDTWNRQLLGDLVPELLEQYISSSFQEQPQRTVDEFFRGWPAATMLRCSNTRTSTRDSTGLLVGGFVKLIAAKDPPLFPTVSEPPNIHHLSSCRKSLCYQRAETEKAQIAHLLNRYFLTVDASENIRWAAEVPDGLIGMLHQLDSEFKDENLLSPETASSSLKSIAIIDEKFRELQSPAFLDYLLSDSRIQNIVGLPVLPTISGSFAQLMQEGDSHPPLFLLDRASDDMVKICRQTLPDLETKLCSRIVDMSSIGASAYQVLQSFALSDSQQLHFVGRSGSYSSTCIESTAYFFALILDAMSSVREGDTGLLALTPSQHKLITAVLSFLSDFSDAAKQNILQCRELRKCRMIPVFGKDMQSVFLASPENALVVQSSSWSPSMITILQQANVHILDEDVSSNANCISYLCDAQLVHRARPADVLKVLVRSKGSKESLGQYLSQFNNEVKSQLGDYFFSISNYTDHSRKPVLVDEEVVDILRCLPLLQVYQADGRSKYASASVDSLVLPHSDIPPHFLDENCITHVQSSSQREFLIQVLKIPQVSLSEFASMWATKHSHLQPAPSSITLQHMTDIAALPQSARSQVAQSMADLQFIPTQSGSLKCAKELFDPNVPDLKLLADENSELPVGDFSSSQGIAALNAVGLRFRQTMDLPQAVKVAKLIEESENREKAFGLLRVLDQKARDGISPTEDGANEDHDKWNELMNIGWCPVLVECPSANSSDIKFVEVDKQSSETSEALNELPWKRSSTGFAKPLDVDVREHMPFMSASRFCLDTQDFPLSDGLRKQFHWDEIRDKSLIVKQLTSVNERLPQKIQSSDQVLNIPRHIAEMYAVLLQTPDLEDLVPRNLEWIWTGWQSKPFTSIDRVAWQLPEKWRQIRAFPLYEVGPALKPLRQYFQQTGVKDAFSASHFAHALKDMADSQSASGFVYKEEEIVLIGELLSTIVNDVDNTIDIIPRSLYVPDEAGVLFPIDGLVYNDASWLEEESAEEGTRPHFCHSALNSGVLQKLGMQSYRMYSAVANEEPDALPCPPAGLLQAMFEGLLGNVDDKAEIKTAFLQLLIQLLDLRAFVDGPQSIEVCLDNRQYPTDRLFTAGLNQFQGPSLILAIKSERGGCHLDMSTITNMQLIHSPLKTQTVTGEVTLGEKFQDETTCLLGLYTISDLPVIIAGSQGVRKRPVGRAYKFCGEGNELSRKFPDQFEAFRPYMDLAKPFPGILIRLPVRDASKDIKRGIVPDSLVQMAADLPKEFVDIFSQATDGLIISSCFGDANESKKPEELDFLKLATLHCHRIGLLAGKLPRIESAAVSTRGETGTLESWRRSKLDSSEHSKLENLYGASSIALDVASKSSSQSGGRDHETQKVSNFAVGKVGAIAVWTPVEDAATRSPSAPSSDDELRGHLLYGKHSRPILEKRPLKAMFSISSNFNRRVIDGCSLCCLEDARNKEIFREGIEHSLQSLLLHLLLGDKNMKQSAFRIWPIPTESTSTAMAEFMTPELTRKWLRGIARLIDWTQYESDLCKILAFGLEIDSASLSGGSGDSQERRINDVIVVSSASPRALEAQASSSVTSANFRLRERILSGISWISPESQERQRTDTAEGRTSKVAVETLMEGLPITMTDGSVRIFGDGPTPCVLIAREAQAEILQNRIPSVSLKVSQVLSVLAPRCSDHLRVFDIAFLVSFLVDTGQLCIGEFVQLPNPASSSDCAISWKKSDTSTKWFRSLYQELAHWADEQQPGAESAELDRLDEIYLIPIQGNKLLRFGLRKAVVSAVDSSIPEFKGAWILDPEIPESASALCYKHPMESVRIVRQMKRLQAHSRLDFFAHASFEDKQALFDRVCESIRQLDLEDLEFIKTLPLFQRADNSRHIPLTSENEGQIFTVPKGTLSLGSSRSNDTVRRIICANDQSLQYKESWKPVYQALEVRTLKAQDVLSEVILPALSQRTYIGEQDISEDGPLREASDLHVLFVDTLSWIKHGWRGLQCNQALMETIQTTPLVFPASLSKESSDQPQSEERRLFRIPELVDPQAPLLCDIYEKDSSFPPTYMRSPEWLQFLKNMGMASKLSFEAIKQAALRIEQRWEADKQTEGSHLYNLATKFTQEFVQRAGDMFTHADFSSMSGIAFVPAIRGVPGGPKEVRVLAKYSDAVPLSVWHLAWTQCPLISDKFIPLYFATSKLRIQNPPTVDTVVRHIREVSSLGDSVLKQLGQRQPILDLTHSLLSFLKQNWASMSSEDKQACSQASFLPVGEGSLLVPPVRVYLRPGNLPRHLVPSLEPFAWEVPPELSSHIDTLSKLGVSTRPDVPRIMSMILSFGRESSASGRPVDPNLLRGYLRAIGFVFDSSKSARVDFSRVYLPSVDGVLLPAAKLVYLDSISSTTIVDRMGTDLIPLVHPGVPQDACEKFNVVPVSRCFQEVVVLSPTPAPSQGQAEVERLCSLLAKEDYIQNLTVILNMLGLRGKAMLPDIKQLVHKFRDSVRPVGRIETRIQPCSGHQLGADISLPAACSVLFHIGASGVLIATEVDEDTDAKQAIMQAVICALSQYLGSIVPLPIAPMLAFEGPDILSIYQSLKIPLIGLASPKAIGHGLGHFGISGFGRGRGAPAHSRWQVVWTLGEILPASLTACLSLEPLKPLFEDELVAIQASSARSPQQQPSYSIARVAKSIKPQAGVAFMKVDLETQPGIFTTARSTDLWVFRSNLSGVEGSSQAASQAQAGGGEPPAAAAAADDDDSTHNPSPSLPGCDVASAISDMLANAGLRSLSPQAQDLLQESVDLKSELQTAREFSDTLSAKVDSLAGQLEDVSARWKCQICFAADIRTVLIPCGHTLCDRCKQQVTSRCPFCRGSVKIRQAMFVSGSE